MNKMIRFASLEKNVMFSPILAEVVMETQQHCYCRRFSWGSCLLVCLSTFAPHQGHSDMIFYTMRLWLIRNIFFPSLEQKGLGRGGMHICKHTHRLGTPVYTWSEASIQVSLVFLNQQDFKHAKVLLLCLFTYHDRGAPHRAVLISEWLSLPLSALVICFPSLYIR